MRIKCIVCGVTFDDNRTGKGRRAKYCGSCSAVLHNKAFKPSPKRFSGLKYRNTPERLEAIKKKYSGGVTEKILAEWLPV